MNILLLIVSILSASIGNCFVHYLGKKDPKYNPYIFSLIVNVTWMVSLLIINFGFLTTNITTWILGLIYGVLLVVFTFSKTKAMTTGPIALASLAGCSAFIITTIFNTIYWKEDISILAIIGIILMIISMVLINIKIGKEHNNKSIDFKWIIYCLLFFIFSALIGIFFRFQQTKDPTHTNEVMIIASLIASLFFLVVSVINIRRNNSKLDNIAITNKKLLFITAISFGVFSLIFNRINFHNSIALPSHLLFPIFNGSILIISLFTGYIIFKEKINKVQLMGIVIGIIAIVLVSNIFGLV